MKRVFLDDNVVVDALLEVDGKMEAALRILSLADMGKIEAYCSSLSLGTASYFMEKVRMSHSLIVRKLNIFCGYCTPTRVDASVVRQALDSDFTDFEDALQYFSALTEKADIIVTRNGRDFIHSEKPVYNPNDFLALMEEKLNKQIS